MSRKNRTKPFYPECEKMQTVQPDSQKLGDFLSWLEEQKIVLSKYDDRDHLFPVIEGRENLLARYFGIDLKKVEKERQQILENIRNMSWKDKQK